MFGTRRFGTGDKLGQHGFWLTHLSCRLVRAQVVFRVALWGLVLFMLGRVVYHAVLFTEQWVRIMAGALG